ncbi:MAG: hypothetical protein ABJA93_14325 [Sporichthyaceae bacterium]
MRFAIPPNSEGREHDERDSGQEEVNVIVAGSGWYRIDGEDVPVRVGPFLRFDPETTHFFGRCANLRRDEPVGGLDLRSSLDA